VRPNSIATAPRRSPSSRSGCFTPTPTGSGSSATPWRRSSRRVHRRSSERSSPGCGGHSC
jgi:hypothetical protein